MSSKNKKSTNNSKKNTPKDLNELIINAAVEKYKSGEISNSLDVENFIDSLLEPLMQKLLDAEFFRAVHGYGPIDIGQKHWSH